MKALSLWQPWASAMALGLKRVETRQWSIRHRGLVAIHAAKRWNRELEEFAERMGVGLELPRGAIVAVGNLVEVWPTDHMNTEALGQEAEWGNYAPGRFAWVFREIRALAVPIPFKGMQGMFNVPDELVA